MILVAQPKIQHAFIHIELKRGQKFTSGHNISRVFHQNKSFPTHSRHIHVNLIQQSSPLKRRWTQIFHGCKLSRHQLVELISLPLMPKSNVGWKRSYHSLFMWIGIARASTMPPWSSICNRFSSSWFPLHSCKFIFWQEWVVKKVQKGRKERLRVEDMLDSLRRSN